MILASEYRKIIAKIYFNTIIHFLNIIFYLLHLIYDECIVFINNKYNLFNNLFDDFIMLKIHAKTF